MLNDFLQVMKSTAIFMLAGQIIIHFLPAGSYEKYVKMIVGMMILAMLAVPILSLGKLDIQDLTAGTLEEYERQMEEITRQVEAAQLQEKDYTYAALLQEIEEKLEEEHLPIPVKVKRAEILENGRLILYVDEAAPGMMEGATEIETEIDTVRPVEIGKTGLENEEEQKPVTGNVQEGNGNTDTDLQLVRIRDSLAPILGISGEQLEVVWDAGG